MGEPGADAACYGPLLVRRMGDGAVGTEKGDPDWLPDGEFRPAGPVPTPVSPGAHAGGAFLLPAAMRGVLRGGVPGKGTGGAEYPETRAVRILFPANDPGAHRQVRHAFPGAFRWAGIRPVAGFRGAYADAVGIFQKAYHS